MTRQTKQSAENAETFRSCIGQELALVDGALKRLRYGIGERMAELLTVALEKVWTLRRLYMAGDVLLRVPKARSLRQSEKNHDMFVVRASMNVL